MQPWAAEGPRAVRRLAAVNYVMGNNGSPLPAGWGWAAESPEFLAPSHLIRSISRGAPVLMSTIEEAGESGETHDKDKNANIMDANIASPYTQETMKNVPIGTETIPEDIPLRLDTLIPQAGARVRRDMHAREPIPSSSKGFPIASSSAGSSQLRQRID